MTKLRKIDYFYLSILIILFLLLVLYLTRFKYVYGSTLDWQDQHWLLPEYFRNLFYSTYDLFPNFALNIGGGQNIYNFSYYGLFSPIILISYLLPFVKMIHYIIITSILEVISSTVLFYVWLKRNNYSSIICFLSSFLFLCASPIIFHSHRQIMFMNYMPFLLLALIGVDTYLNKKKSLLMIISIFLFIMTSYYFSIGCILVIILYALYKKIKMAQRVTFKELLLTSYHFIFPIFIAILMSGILILPTISAIFNGRNGVDFHHNIINYSLLLPSSSLENILYDPYSLGLTSIALISIIYGIFSKKKERLVLSFIISIILIFPIFAYLLNGTLYSTPKSLIPFIPLVCLLSANFFNDLFQNTIKKRILVLIIIIFGFIGITSTWEYRNYFIANLAITILAIYFYCRTRYKLIIIVPVILICSLGSITINSKDTLLLKSSLEKEQPLIAEELVNNVLNTDKSFYRFSNELYSPSNVNKVYSTNFYQSTLYSSIYNKNYNNFYCTIFNNEISYRNSVITSSTHNILFNILMGNKYIITSNNPPIGYDLIAYKDNISIYKNDNVFPLGYSTDKLMSTDYFNTLKYPYTSEALLNYCIVKNANNSNYTTKISSIDPGIISLHCMNLEYYKTKDGYSITADNNARMILTFNESAKDKIYFIRFHMNSQDYDKDTSIIINSIVNKLTCKSWKYQNNNFIFDYALSSNASSSTLNLKFSKGEYRISDIEAYSLDYETIKSINSSLDNFEVDTDKTNGDTIAGKITVKNDGYFVLNIPYDKGFTIKVNNKIVDYEKVNTSFIGFPINKGEYTIQINYQAPLQKEGEIMSLIGFLLAITEMQKIKNARKLRRNRRKGNIA